MAISQKSAAALAKLFHFSNLLLRFKSTCKLMRFFGLPIVVFASLATPLLAGCEGPNSRSKPTFPQITVVVDQTGQQRGSYRTIQEGVSKLTKEKSNLFIYPGEYKEQVIIPKELDQVLVQGYTCDTTQYSQNKVTITQARAQRDVGDITDRNFQSSTLGIKAGHVKLYNLNVANTVGRVAVSGQGVAVFAGGTDHGFYGCSFTGYQNTVAAYSGRVLIARSHISGAVDFIFGQWAMAWFENCDLEVVGNGYITANGNNSPTPVSAFVFNKAHVHGKGQSYLGRPWRPYSRCVFQNSYLEAVVAPEGWSTWKSESTSNVYFKEFKNNGPGANTNKRVTFSGQLNAPVDIKSILGNYNGAFFYDGKYM